MNTAQAAKYLGMGTRTIRHFVLQAELPAEREETARGPVYWFKKSDLDFFREARARAALAVEKRGPGRPPKVPRKPD